MLSDDKKVLGCTICKTEFFDKRFHYNMYNFCSYSCCIIQRTIDIKKEEVQEMERRKRIPNNHASLSGGIC
jgi:hypothetical protein